MVNKMYFYCETMLGCTCISLVGSNNRKSENVLAGLYTFISDMSAHGENLLRPIWNSAKWEMDFI